MRHVSWFVSMAFIIAYSYNPLFFGGGGGLQKCTCRNKSSLNLKNLSFTRSNFKKNCKGLIQYAGKEVGGGGSCIGILIRMLHIWEIRQCRGWDLAVTDAPLPDVNF